MEKEKNDVVITSRNNRILLNVSIRDLFRSAISKAAGYSEEIKLDKLKEIIFNGDIKDMSEFKDNIDKVKNEVNLCYDEMKNFLVSIETDFDNKKKEYVDLKDNKVKKITFVDENDVEETKKLDSEDNSSGSAKIENNNDSNSKNLF